MQTTLQAIHSLLTTSLPDNTLTGQMLWFFIREHNGFGQRTGEVCAEKTDLIQDANYCGTNTAGSYAIMPLFYNECDNFVGIWVSDEHDELDQLPVQLFCFDVDFSDEEDVGNQHEEPMNFRAYIHTLLTDFLAIHTTEDAYGQLACLMLTKLTTFSTTLLPQPNYPYVPA